MSPELLAQIQARAKELIDVEQPVTLHGALDRHALLREMLALQSIALFLLEHCQEPDVPIQESGLDPYAVRLMGNLALGIAKEKQKAAEAQNAVEDAMPVALEDRIAELHAVMTPAAEQ